VVAVDLRMAAVERMLALAAQCVATAKKDRPSIQRLNEEYKGVKIKPAGGEIPPSIFALCSLQAT